MNLKIIHLGSVVVLMAVLAELGHAAERSPVIILPESLSLTRPMIRHRLLVETVDDGQITGQLREGVTFESSDPNVVTVEDGVAIATGNGTATITAKVGGQSAATQVTVTGFGHPRQWSFRNHVQSVLSKAGCNSGACHGAAAGKNGFKLSLRGYDPQADFFAITRQSRGRRITSDDPGRSLILTKPSGAIPHKGGLRFKVDSPEYRVIAEWIASGNRGLEERDPRIERLEILPEATLLRPQSQQQLVVRAHFSDGHVEDVTQWAKFTSTNHTVAQVSDSGLVNVMGSGEGAVVAWYLSRNVIATVTVPYSDPVPPRVFAESPRSNFIDTLVLEKLQRLNIPPSPQASDEQFVRRAFLDTIGTLPTSEETREFLADQSPDKRDRLIEMLLARPEFVDYWAWKWSDLLLVTGERLRPQAVKTYYQWIRDRVAENTPWDQFARQVILANGGTLENGAANFYALHQDPQDMSETVSMAFLGMSINCARCHDHPLEKWTNDDYYGMANLFARVRAKGWGGDSRNGDGNRTIFVADRGELIQPRTGRPQPPRPLDGTPVPFDSTDDRRAHLADWLTSPRNPYFSRAIVNRVWANFLGVGLVEAVDDMRLTNPASNEPLLRALAEELVRNQYDLKELMRLILKSQTYQRSSEPLPGNKADERFYSHSMPRRLPAEVLLDAISQVTGTPTSFKDYPAGTRAVQLPDSSVQSYFLKTFGRPERLITCECERADEPSMVQVLHLVNGETINEKLAAKDSRVSRLLDANAPPEQFVEDVYLSALSRSPTPEEQARILAIINAAKPEEQRPTLEDLCWSILSSREFLFQH